ncbi:N/A [soil metagenome]
MTTERDADRPLTRRQEQAAATRSQLLLAAREVFEAKGYQGTTVGAITARAATAHGTFYLYFDNKEHCFNEVMAEVTDLLYRGATTTWATEPYAGIEHAIRGFLTLFTAHGGLWRCVLEGMLSSPTIRSLWLDIRRNFSERVARGLRARQETGMVRALDADVAAEALCAMAEWFAFTHFVVGPYEPDAGAIDDAAAVLTDLWFHAVYGGAAG